MSIKKGAQVELLITDMAAGGRGVAHMDGMAVFVDHVVPQDRVLAQIIKKKRQYAVARMQQILEKSPHRVKAPCEYSGFCGGCKWQFVNYPQQLVYKRQQVAEALEHIGGINGVTVHATLPSERIFGYRNKMEFSCSDRRWLLPEEMDKEGVEKGFALGLHVPGTFHKVLDTRACLLQPDVGNRILGDVRQFIKKSRAPVYGLRSHQGFWRYVMLRNAAAYDQWMVNVITAYEDRTELQPLADYLMETYPQVVSVVNNINARKAGIAQGEYEVSLAGEARFEDKIGPFRFDISANSFFQTNTRAAETLYRTIKEYAELSGAEKVVDLYSGTGAIAIYLARAAGNVIGIEIIPDAVADAKRNCRKNRIENCRFVLGDIKDRLPQVCTDVDVLIIDPPRAGMHKDVLEQVRNSAPPKIVYVSCNPATLARDLGVLKQDYHLLEVRPIDMFPHTAHVEAVARLQKR